jgi:hypothetical protein
MILQSVRVLGLQEPLTENEEAYTKLKDLIMDWV